MNFALRRKNIVNFKGVKASVDDSTATHHTVDHALFVFPCYNPENNERETVKNGNACLKDSFGWLYFTNKVFSFN